MGLEVALSFSLALLNRTNINKKKRKFGTKIAKSQIRTLLPKRKVSPTSVVKIL